MRGSNIFDGGVSKQSQILGNTVGSGGTLNKFINSNNLTESVIGPSSTPTRGGFGSTMPSFPSNAHNELTLEM